MTLSLFIPSWRPNVEEIVHHVKIALGSRFGAEPHRGPLTRARDQLYEMVQEFDRNGLSDENETLYAMFFDALSYLAFALQNRPVQRSSLASAQTILDELCMMQLA